MKNIIVINNSNVLNKKKVVNFFLSIIDIYIWIFWIKELIVLYLNYNLIV